MSLQPGDYVFYWSNSEPRSSPTGPLDKSFSIGVVKAIDESMLASIEVEWLYNPYGRLFTAIHLPDSLHQINEDEAAMVLLAGLGE